MLTAGEIREKDGGPLLEEQQEVTVPVLERLPKWAERVGVIEPIQVSLPQGMENVSGS